MHIYIPLLSIRWSQIREHLSTFFQYSEEYFSMKPLIAQRLKTPMAYRSGLIDKGSQFRASAASIYEYIRGDMTILCAKS